MLIPWSSQGDRLAITRSSDPAPACAGIPAGGRPTFTRCRKIYLTSCCQRSNSRCYVHVRERDVNRL